MVKSKRDVKSPRYNKTPLVVPRPVSTRSATAGTGGANVKVVVRVRPPNNKEEGDNSRTVVKVVDNQMLVFDPKEDSQVFFYHGVKQKGRDLLKRANKNMQFVFDRVFGFDSTNNDIFHDSTQPLISSLMDGYNCSVFVYGATGAGKTHTMLGHNEHPGITFLTMEELFKKKDELKNERDFEIGITYLEVYNELVQDLLNPGSPLQLREDGKYGVTVAGIQVKRINDVEELFRLLVQGNQNRTQHPTDANAESSRSHAVFQVYLRMSIHTTAEIRLAKLSMIDLAGSERGAATGCAGARFTEGANINKSLLALGNCINSLADGHRHVPYRDSKLTRLLKDSLGGNCQTIMIANVSPSSLSYDDTYNTLKYATRAKKIKSNVKKNIVSCETHVSQYVKMVEELNKEVARLKMELNKKQTVVSAENTVDEASCKKLKTLYSKKNVLLEQIHHLESSEQILLHRRQMKEEANARLSDVCIDSPDLHQGHKQLESAVERLHRQEDCFKNEIVHLRHNMSEMDTEIEELLKENPSLKDLADKEEFVLKEKIYKHKLEHKEKLYKLQQNELQMRGKLMETMSKMLKPLFLQLRGHGLATNASISEYQEFVRSVRGIRSVTWDDDVPDVEVEGSTTFVVHEDEKKTSTEDSATSTSSLNDTFVMPTPTKPIKVCADQLMAKVCKPPVKRMFKVGNGSPRFNKENRVPPKRLVGTMGTAQRFASATDKKGATRIRNAIQPLTHANTPSKQKGLLKV